MSEGWIVFCLLLLVFGLRVGYELWDWHVAKQHEKARRKEAEDLRAKYHRLYDRNASQEAQERYDRHTREQR